MRSKIYKNMRQRVMIAKTPQNHSLLIYYITVYKNVKFSGKKCMLSHLCFYVKTIIITA